jgi:hypothetical protein
MLSEVETANLAPHLRATPHKIELPHEDSAFLLIGAVAQNKPPSSLSQTSSVNTVKPTGFNTAIFHRLFPLYTVSGDKSKFITYNAVARFMNDSFSASFFCCSLPQHSA